MAGKGSKRRPGDEKKFRDGWDRIFGKNKSRKPTEKELRYARHFGIPDEVTTTFIVLCADLDYDNSFDLIHDFAYEMRSLLWQPPTTQKQAERVGLIISEFEMKKWSKK